jgi:hypothetical protein
MNTPNQKLDFYISKELFAGCLRVVINVEHSGCTDSASLPDFLSKAQAAFATDAEIGQELAFHLDNP